MKSRKTDLYHALDPVAFARDRLNFNPDPWQASVLRSDHKRVLLNCSRQSGKSTTVSILAAHRLLYHPGSLGLLVAPTNRQSAELLLKTNDHLDHLGVHRKKGAKGKYSCELENGSRILALPGSERTIRGYSSVDLLVIDEAAFVADKLYQTARPMLAVSQGRLIAMSTPFGKRGWFHAEWAEGAKTWHRVKVPATEVPRISQEFLEEERRSLGPLTFASEYECKFIDTANQLFSFEVITEAFSGGVKELFRGDEEWLPSSHFYVGLDLAQATDYTALAVIEAVPEPGGDATSLRCRYLQRFPLGTSYLDIVRDVQALMSREPLKDHATLVVDSTGVGRPIVDSFRSSSFELVPITITGGSAVTEHDNELRVPKRDLVGELHVRLQSRKLKIAGGTAEEENLKRELGSFQVTINASGHDSYGAESASGHDDLVLALALATYQAKDNGIPAYGEIVYERNPYRFSDSDY